MSISDRMAVTVPEGTSGNVTIERFTVGDPMSDLEAFMAAQQGRGIRPGEYTRLLRNGDVWMSDTTAERNDHYSAALAIQQHGGRLLIGGLGLGMILNYALTHTAADHWGAPPAPLEHIDVVEMDPDVVALAWPHYEAMAAAAGVPMTLHLANLWDVRWRPGTTWDVAYFDIWRDLCTDNLAEYTRLRRSYGRRATWCDCWARETLRYYRQRERASVW